MPDYRGWLGRQDLPIAHLDTDAFVAVQAGTIDTNRLAREQPADCQRIRTSYTEPFLFTVDRYLEWGGYEGKRTNGRDPVGVWIHPYRGTVTFSKIMNDLAPFFDRAAQSSGQFTVVGSLSCGYQAAYDDMIGFVEGLGIRHRSPLKRRSTLKPGIASQAIVTRRYTKEQSEFPAGPP